MSFGCSKTVGLGWVVLGNSCAWGEAGEGCPGALDLTPGTNHPDLSGPTISPSGYSVRDPQLILHWNMPIFLFHNHPGSLFPDSSSGPRGLHYHPRACPGPCHSAQAPALCGLTQAGRWAQPPANLHTCIIRDVRASYLGTWQIAGRTSRRIQTGTSATADVWSLAKRSHGGGFYPASSFHNSRHRQTTHRSSLLPTSFPGTNAHPDSPSEVLHPE